MPRQSFVLPTDVSSVQVAPESADVQMFPLSTTAASFVPSLEEVMPNQDFVLPTDVSSVQVAPESADVQMFPPLTTAASFVPSLEEVMPRQSLPAPDGGVTSVQLAPKTGTSAHDHKMDARRTLSRRPMAAVRPRTCLGGRWQLVREGL